MVRIIKGDSVDFASSRELAVTILTTLSLEGFTGKFDLLGIVRTFTAEQIASRHFNIVYTAAETEILPLGRCFGIFTLYDPEGREADIARVLVEVYPPDCCCHSASRNPVFIGMVNVVNYPGIGNKPKLNGVEIEGDHDSHYYKLGQIAVFNPEDVYERGEQVVKGDDIWICTAETTGPGDWDEKAWTRAGGSIVAADSKEDFPEEGDAGRLYLDRSDSELYWWDGEAYKRVQVEVDEALDEHSTNPVQNRAIAELVPEGTDPVNQLVNKRELAEAVSEVATAYVTYDAEEHPFPTAESLIKAAVVYDAGVPRPPKRNDYAIVVSDETHGGSMWRYAYVQRDAISGGDGGGWGGNADDSDTPASLGAPLGAQGDSDSGTDSESSGGGGGGSGRWVPQYQIENGDYKVLRNKPKVNGHTLEGDMTPAQLGLVPDARKVNGKSLDKDVTLTSFDIKVVAGEEETVGAALQHKRDLDDRVFWRQGVVPTLTVKRYDSYLHINMGPVLEEAELQGAETEVPPAGLVKQVVFTGESDLGNAITVYQNVGAAQTEWICSGMEGSREATVTENNEPAPESLGWLFGDGEVCVGTPGSKQGRVRDMFALVSEMQALADTLVAKADVVDPAGILPPAAGQVADALDTRRAVSLSWTKTPWACSPATGKDGLGNDCTYQVHGFADGYWTVELLRDSDQVVVESAQVAGTADDLMLEATLGTQAVEATREVALELGDTLNPSKLLAPAGHTHPEHDPIFEAWKNGANVVAGGGASSEDLGGDVAIGRMAAVGAVSDGGVAIGDGAKAGAAGSADTTGAVAVGKGAQASAKDSAAFGKNAKAQADCAVQLGEGTNQEQNSLQFRNTKLVDGNGKIPAASLDKAVAEKNDVQLNTRGMGDWTFSDGRQWVIGKDYDASIDPSRPWVIKATTIVGVNPQQTVERAIETFDTESECDAELESAIGFEYPGVNDETVEATRSPLQGYVLGDNLPTNPNYGKPLPSLDANGKVPKAQLPAEEDPHFTEWKNGDAVAAGSGAEASGAGGAALGKNAKATAAGAVQLGAGTNNVQNSLQFKGTTVVGSDGKIPASSLNVNPATKVTGATADNLASLTADGNIADSGVSKTIFPTQASAQNQLADKDFVNSSVATNTANYISDNGEPFTSLAALQAYSGPLTNNDYAFVVGTDAAGNTQYTRYKYNANANPPGWSEEYVLNNSSFTAEQWAAISSGITAELVTKLNGIAAGAQVNVIETVKVNGSALTPDGNKAVNVIVPTTAADVGAVPTTRTVNGKSLDADITLTPADVGAVPVAETLSWAQLVTKRTNSSLVPGAYYRINDYEATTSSSIYYQATPHQFDIIVLALSPNVLSERAYAAKNATDSYFRGSRLEAWTVWYCLENDASRFGWADTVSGKGVVYRLIDEFGNDCPYDFKGITFYAEGDSDNVLRYTFDSGASSGNTDQSISGYANGVHDNIIGRYASGSVQLLNRIVFKGGAYGNRFAEGGNDCTFSGDCRECVFGRDFYNNRFAASVTNCRFGDFCSFNTIASGSYIRFGDMCHSNALGHDCVFVTMAGQCYNNTLGDYCSYNAFGFGDNTIRMGNNCSNNTFGSGCFNFYFGDYCQDDTFGNYCHDISVGSRCSACSFGNACGNIVIGSKPANFSSTTQYAVGDVCYRGGFVYRCKYAYMGYWDSDYFEKDPSSVVKSYCRNLRVEEGVQYIFLDPPNDTSSSAYYQNVKIKSGVVGTSGTPKVITDGRKNQTFNTTYRPADSEEISV